MSRTIAGVSWHESAEELSALYRQEREVERRKRLQALWLVRRGHSASSAARQAGVGRRTLTRWLAWYRVGGLPEVLARVPGHGAPGAACRLSDEQRHALVQQSGLGQFRTYQDARQWVLTEYGVGYSYTGMYTLLAKLAVHPRVPRPRAERAEPEAPAAWKKGGLAEPWRRQG